MIRDWGSTPDERADRWPCDDVLPHPDLVAWRGVDVDAPVAVVYRWLCQLRVAPYSYDWIDNLGRRSPRTLTPGLEHLEVGQRIATIFRVVSSVTDDHVTMRADHRLFGDVVVTYRVRPGRLAAKLLVRHRDDVLGQVWRRVLPAGDLVMMRKQLHTLRDLAEAT